MLKHSKVIQQFYHQQSSIAIKYGKEEYIELMNSLYKLVGVKFKT